nr:hypothetical protein [uncultured Cohaesibacter sp.]
MRLNICYHFDPACCLDILIDTEEGYHLYSFQTRAYSLRHALAHAALSAREQRISLPLIGLAPGVKWLSGERDCCEITLHGQGPFHPCAPDIPQQKT